MSDVKGRSADTRIIGAIQNLVDQFQICGLKAPLAIVVEPGQEACLKALIEESGFLLVADKRATETSIWGVKVVERESN